MQKKLSSKELVAAGHQFAANLSSDTPLIDMAKMVSQLATQLDVALVAAGEAGKQRDAVLAENVMLKNYLKECAIFQGEGNWTNDAEKSVYVPATEWLPPTPATDAQLNAVRAEGVDYVAQAIGAKCAELKVGSKDWKALKSIVFTLTGFATQLRAETDTTPSQYESLAGGK